VKTRNMPKLTVKSAADTSKKWGDVTPGRSGYYESETPGAASSWEANTIAAGPTFKTAVAAGNIDKLYVGGVKRAGAEKFARKVKDVGVSRFGPGVSAAITDFEKNWTDFQTVLAGIDKPAKRPRGDPGNRTIIATIDDALYKKRLALLGAAVAAA